jgi:hypothetical protein
MPDTHDGGEIGILEMMGRASGTYHWQFFVILKRSSRRQQDLGFHLPALPSTANGLSDQTHHKIEYVCSRAPGLLPPAALLGRGGRLMAKQSLSSRSAAARLSSLRELSCTAIATAQRLAARAGAKAGGCPGHGSGRRPSA